MHESDFALQWLDYLGNEIYNNGRRIFRYEGEPKYDISRLTSRIKIGVELGNEKAAEYTIMPYSELKKLGYAVMMGTEWIWRERQQCYYKIRRIEKNDVGITEKVFERKLQLQHDPSNRRLRLIGEDVFPENVKHVNSGVGPWVVYDEDRPKEYNTQARREAALTKEAFRASLKAWTYGKTSNEAEYAEIKELPVLMSDEKYIVCIRKATTCQRIIVVGEPGMGKSVDEYSLILYLQDGEIKVDKIKDIQMSDNLKIMTVSGWNKVKGYIKHNDDRERIKITTRTGKILIGTPDHSFIVMNKKGEIISKKGEELALNDCFITPKKFKIEGMSYDDFDKIDLHQERLKVYMRGKDRRIHEDSIQINSDFAFFIGIFLAEGCLSENTICISNCNKDIQDKVKDFCLSNKIKLRQDNRGIEFNHTELYDWLKKECYDSPKVRKGKGSGAERKKIPNLVYNQDGKFMDNLISGIFSGDGYIQHVIPKSNHKNRTKKSFFIGIDLCSERLIDDLGLLLSFKGILSSKNSNDKNGRRHKLSITGTYVTKFLEDIRLYDKVQKIFRISETDSFDIIPFTTLFRNVLKDNKLSKKWANFGIKEWDNRYGYLGRRGAEKLVKKFEEVNPDNKTLQKIKELMNKPWFYDRIIKIEKIEGSGLVYDLETEDNTFLANNIFVHNSLGCNAIAGRIFYVWEDRVGWLIDPLNQFNDISLPQGFDKFNKINGLINNDAKPIPAVQMYLACKNKINIKHEDISLLLTLDYIEFLKKYKFYTFGIKDMDVGDTIRYLEDSFDEIKDATSSKEIRDIMIDKVPNAKDKGVQAMIYKWVNTFEVIFKEKFTSNLYLNEPMATHKLKVKFRDGTAMEGHPFIMCYEAGLIPILNISSSRRQRWIRNYLAYLMQDIVAHQTNVPEDRKHRVWIVADELNEIYELGKKKDNAFLAFEEMYRQGRFNNIGFIGNTQSLEKLNPEMYKNATHICCVYMKDHKERKRVGDTYDLDKDTYNKIESLKEQEMMVFSKEPFVIYDRWGKRRVVDRKWFKGKILPPINFHKVP